VQTWHPQVENRTDDFPRLNARRLPAIFARLHGSGARPDRLASWHDPLEGLWAGCVSLSAACLGPRAASAPLVLPPPPPPPPTCPALPPPSPSCRAPRRSRPPRHFLRPLCVALVFRLCLVVGGSVLSFGRISFPALAEPAALARPRYIGIISALDSVIHSASDADSIARRLLFSVDGYCFVTRCFAVQAEAVCWLTGP